MRRPPLTANLPLVSSEVETREPNWLVEIDRDRFALLDAARRQAATIARFQLAGEVAILTSALALILLPALAAWWQA